MRGGKSNREQDFAQTVTVNNLTLTRAAAALARRGSCTAPGATLGCAAATLLPLPLPLPLLSTVTASPAALAVSARAAAASSRPTRASSVASTRICICRENSVVVVKTMPSSPGAADAAALASFPRERIVKIKIYGRGASQDGEQDSHEIHGSGK